ncbi:MAG: sigma 54-interacting transcriptional regulator, partial [Vicinamibacterales bacterium]
TFGRSGGHEARALRVEPMGGSALRAMVYIDRQEGPAMNELDNGVRAADGRPGLLVERLRGVHWSERRPAISVVHETAPAYLLETSSPPRPPAGSMGRRLRGAPERAAQLVAHGRHAAAGRLLDRASRVLTGRGEPQAAARCVLARGWVLRDRGHSEAAVRQFEQAQLLGPQDDEVGVRAALGIGVVWTDELRLEPAEAILRSAHAAALVVDDSAAADEATRALARCLLWQQRAGEAAALLGRDTGRPRGVDHWALLTRVHVAEGDVTRAGHAASQARALAEASGGPRDRAVAARAATLARASAGDTDGARTAALEGLHAAAAAHLPLLGIRIRVALLSATTPGEPAQRMAGQLRGIARRGVPALLQHAIAAACAARDERQPRPTPPPDHALADLRELLESTHAAKDDGAALQAVAEAVLQRLRASSVMLVAAFDSTLVSRAGRPWAADAPIVLRCLAAGAAIVGDSAPLECAAPIRYGGETIGALACRWSAGAIVDAERASAACQAAALAAASSLRGLADRAPAAEPNATWENLLGTSPPAGDLRRAILSAARAPFPVLVLGESGSGKELVARAIHRLGPRRHRRLCTINCAAISDELLEAELFGHTRGAFTGAVSERAGLFEEADGGTLFLDEVGELTARAQAKLLRVLQDGEVRRVGENLPRRVDTRVVAATNRCLEAEVTAGRFRADLRFRLDVIRIAVPPLRDRATDIPAMVAHFWEDAAARVGSRATLAPETVAALTRYDWPGNVRELQNAVASLAVHGPRRGRITPSILPQQVARSAAPEPATFEAARVEFERRYVRAALARAGGARSSAARALGVSRQGLAKMLRRLDLDAPDGPAAS